MSQRHIEDDHQEVEDLPYQLFLDEGHAKTLPLVHDEVSNDWVCEDLRADLILLAQVPDEGIPRLPTILEDPIEL